MKDKINVITNKKYYKNSISILVIVIGAFLIALGTNFYLTPHHTFPLGLMGLSGEVANIIGFIPSVDKQQTINLITWIIYLLLNIPLLILAWYKIGKKFTILTAFFVILVTIFGMVLPSSTTGNYKIPTSFYISDPLVSIIFAAILLGSGLGIVLKYGGSTGGTDIVALYLAFYKKKSFTKYNFIFNFLIVIFAVLISFHPNISSQLEDGQIYIAVLMMIMLVVWTSVVEFIHDSNKKVSLMIITNKKDEIIDWITNYSGRSATVINSQGAKTKIDNNIILVTMSYIEKKAFINKIKEIDDKVWITILETENVVGEFNDKNREEMKK